MPQHLEGKTAIVTGSGRGIGRGIALAMAAQGASVVVNDFGGSVEGEGRDTSVAQEVVDEITNAGGTAIVNGADVSDHREAEDLVRQALNEFGALDILVNVAGILRERMIFNMTEQEWDDVIRVHLKGTYNTTHFASIHWRQRREYGRLINFSSTAGINGSAGQPNYAAAKAGLIGLTRSIAKETSRYGITSNAICPAADTRMTINDAVIANRERKLKDGLISQEEYNRAARPRGPEYIAPMVAYLCTDEAQDVNGHVFHVERNRIHNYYFGEEMKALHKGGDGLFTVDELLQDVPSSIMNGVARVAAPYEKAS